MKKKSDPIIVVYVTSPSVRDTEHIGNELLRLRLCACVNIIPHMKSMYFWPPKSGIIEKSEEAILLIKTISSKYNEVEHIVKKLHSSECPCIIQVAEVKRGCESYMRWLQSEVT